MTSTVTTGGPLTGRQPSRPVPADAVRVWRGFRAPAMALPDFFQRLNTVFVPATVLMQIAVGLHGYLPAVPAGMADKPDRVPDVTALLFWESQQDYHDGFNTLAVRTYTLTHAAGYTPDSRADFPVRFTGAVVADQPYHLSDRPADWMAGPVWHLLCQRPPDQDPAGFLVEVARRLAARQATGGFAGAIACAGRDYLAYWELGQVAATEPDDAFAAVGQPAGWRYLAGAQPTTIEHGLWESWPGTNVNSGDFLNLQFARRGKP